MRIKELIRRLDDIRNRFRDYGDKLRVTNLIKDIQRHGVTEDFMEKLKYLGYGFKGDIAKVSGWNSIEEAFGIYDVYRDWYPLVKSVLDVGGGMGLFYQYIESNQYPMMKDYYALDLSEAMVKGCRENFPEIADNVEVADLVEDNGPFLDRFYDMVVMFGVTGDFGHRKDMTKWDELGKVLDKVLPIASKILIVTFPDDWEVVQPIDEMPITTWSPESVDKFFEGVEGYSRRKVCDGMFGIVLNRFVE